MRKGIVKVDLKSRRLLLTEFARALADAFDARGRNAEGDYAPDPKAQRFPEWQRARVGTPAPVAANVLSLKGMLEAWWREAKAAGRKPSTYESYRNSMAAFVAFLKHDDADRVMPEDVVRFKDHRLSTTLIEALAADCKLRDHRRLNLYDRCGAHFPDVMSPRPPDEPARAQPKLRMVR